MKKSTKFDIITMGLYAIIIIISFVLTMIFFENYGFVTVIVAIALIYMDKFILPRRKEVVNKETMKKTNQRIFDILTELSIICIERVADKNMRRDERDRNIFALFSKLTPIQNDLIRLGIVVNASPKKSTIWMSYLIEDVLIIIANVDNPNHLVWFASIYLNGKHNAHPNQEQLISEVYPVLEKFRKKNKMNWSRKIHQFFIN